MMRPNKIILLLAVVLCSILLKSEAKLQQQAAIADADEDDDDDWDEDEDDDDKPEVDDDGRIYKNPRNSPSAMCPRDVEQAGLLGQKCLRKCSTDEDCKSPKKKCRCDGVCGMSCIKPERECPVLNEIPHGTMTVTGRLFGDRAHYVCDPNYYTVGLAERSCRADGLWSGTTPACKKDHSSFCSDPRKIRNAKHNAPVEQTTFNLETTVQYFCDHGFQPTGIAQAKCLMMHGNASWFGPDLTCDPRSCGAPTDIPNGWHAGECYTYDCRVAYHCVDGWELVGKPEKICLADGTWSPKELPQCVQVTSVQCPQPENPRNGKAVTTSNAYNSIVSYECNYGYMIVGQQTRRCSADRRWSGQPPVCEEINCGSPGILYNGWIENIESGTNLGASLIFRCKEHMKHVGNTSSVCQSDGKWRYPLPHCLAPCVVPQIEKGNITVASHERDHINNVTVVEHGERLLVSCIQNYEFAANSTPVVCQNGTWSIVPTCSPARCKQMPKSPKNGMVIAPKTDHGMRAVFKCKDGFSLVGGGPNNSSKHVECRYGNWTGDIPHCIEVYCSFPGYLENGKVLLVGNMGVYDYRPYVKKVPNNKQIMYDCDKGYVLSEGPPGATCIGGNWSPRELPACLPGQHPRLRWSRRRRSIDVIEQKTNNTTTSYRKFIDFFRRIGKKLLIELNHVEHNKSHAGQKKTFSESNDRHMSNSTEEPVGSKIDNIHNTVDGKIDGVLETVMNNSIDGLFTRKKHTGHKNKSRSKDDRMVDFLRVVYRKLRRIDSRRNNNVTNTSMHELLNLMSKNFFHVDLAESRRNNSNRNHEGFEVRNQREFTKLKREFERIMKFYNKSLRWSEKQSRKESKKRKIVGHGEKRIRVTKDKKKKRNKSKSYYKGFYEFINGYVNEKLSILESQNGTDELMRKMNIDKFTVRNGTTFTVGEIYAFFKHIIENKLNIAVESVEGATTTGSTIEVKELDESNDNQTSSVTTTSIVTVTSPSSIESLLGNEIPTNESNNHQHEVKKHRTKRIRNAIEETTATYQNRKLLSVYSPLSNVRPKSTVPQTFHAMSLEAIAKSKQFTLNGLDAQQQSRSKRFLSSAELDNQIILKNLYLNAYEDEYRANVRRSISQNNHANWTALRRRKGNLDHYEIK